MSEFNPDEYLSDFSPDEYLAAGGGRAPGTGMLSGTLEGTTGAAVTGMARALPYLSSEKFMELAGVPKGPGLSALGAAPENASVWEQLKTGKIAPGGMFDVSARGAAGVVGDYLVGVGLKRGMEKLANFAGRVPLWKLNRELKKVGAAPVEAEVIKKALTKEDVFEALKSELGKVSQARKELVENVATKGVPEDMGRALSNAEAILREVETSGSAEVRKLAPKFRQMIDDQRALMPRELRPTTITRKSQFVPVEPSKEIPVSMGQTTMPSVPEPKPTSLITGRPVTTPRHKLPPQPVVSPQTRSVIYPEEIVELDPFTGAPKYRTESKPIVAATAGPAPQQKWATDPLTGLPIKKLSEKRIAGEIAGPREQEELFLKALRGEDIPYGPDIPIRTEIPGRGIKETLQTKTGMGETLPKGAFGETNVSDVEERFRKAFAGGFKDESERIAEQAIPGAGEQLAKENKKIQTMLAALPKAEQAAIVQAGKLPVTQIDTLLLSLDPASYAAKNIGRLVGTPGFWTQSGRGLRLLSKPAPYIGPTIDILGMGREQSPWEQMSQ